MDTVELTGTMPGCLIADLGGGIAVEWGSCSGAIMDSVEQDWRRGERRGGAWFEQKRGTRGGEYRGERREGERRRMVVWWLVLNSGAVVVRGMKKKKQWLLELQ